MNAIDIPDAMSGTNGEEVGMCRIMIAREAFYDACFARV
jgi:hypothetical protein